MGASAARERPGFERRTVRLITEVEEYIFAAMRRARVDILEDGTVGATVAECPGAIAFGADVHGCARELHARLEDWARVGLQRGFEIPAGVGASPK